MRSSAGVRGYRSPSNRRSTCRRLTAKLVCTGKHLFLLIGRFEAYIIPWHAFATERSFLDFVALCSDYFDRAPQPAPKTALSTILRKPL